MLPMTNNPRIYLWIAVALMIWLNYDAWNRDYGVRNDVITRTTQVNNGSTPAAPVTGDLANLVPQAANGTGGNAASGATQGPAAAVPNPAAGTVPSASGAISNTAAAPNTADSAAAASSIHVLTDVLDLQISTRGGTITQADLLQYPKVKGEAAPVRLENEGDPLTLYLLQSGLTGPGNTPNHLAAFTSANNNYQLGNAAELRVPLTWTDDH